MNSVPTRDFMELHQIHQHQPHCKQQCFVFTDIGDIDLAAPEITKFPEKLTNGSLHSYCNKKESISPPPVKSRSRKILTILGGLFICLGLAVGIPLGLQLRSSSLLEARLAFIRRLLAESLLVEGYWSPHLDGNFSYSITEVKESMVGALLWPISVPCGAQYLDAVQLALEGIDEARRISKGNPTLRIVSGADEMEQAHSDSMVGVLLGLEGGHTLGASLAVLRSMYSLGARFVSLTGIGCTTPWVASSKQPDIILDETSPHSLTTFGETLVLEMNRLGMLVEISRLSEPAMRMTLHTAKAPVLFSNAAPLYYCNSTTTASIPDHILAVLPQNGAVVMINVERCGEKRLTLKEAIASINYVRALAGIDHVGLSGSPKIYPHLLAELARDRLWSNAAIQKLAGGNIVKVLRKVEESKGRLPLYEDWIPISAIEGNSYCRYPET